MSVDLFERYRDALRRGHVAAARGELEAARAAYAEAIRLAPDRPVAHVGLGAIHVAAGDLAAALGEYDVALSRAPRDEAALSGRAEVLAKLGRRVDAAETLDRLSQVLESAGRLPDALDAATRAVALAEGKARRRHLVRLRAQLAPDAPVDGAQADGPDGDQADDGDEAGVPTTDLRDDAVAAAGTEGAGEPEAAGEAIVEPPAEAPAEARAEPPVLVDGLERMTVAEDAYDRGDLEVARLASLMAADAFRREGRPSAAIDACALGLGIAPDDPALHLTLVNLYLERGWRTRAAEKLVLLGRLADLDGDEATRIQVCAVADAEFPADLELEALCRSA